MLSRLAVTALAFLLAACASTPLPELEANAAPPFPNAENRAAFALAHVDVETTGLDPAFHEMIDIGAIYTDLDGKELGRFYVRILPDHPERLSPGAAAVNGFSVGYWKAHGAVPEAEAVRQFLAFHQQASAGRTMIFTAWNAQFDRRFLGALLHQHGSGFAPLFHYYVLDVPSMAWALGLEDLAGRTVGPKLGVPPETSVPEEHVGMTGAEFNVAVYRALLARRQAR